MTQVSDDAGGRSALVLGATGLVGGHCLDLLLASSRYHFIRTITRRPLPRSAPRLDAHVFSLDDMPLHRELFAVDDVFCCLGGTIRKAGSQEAFRTIDVEYPEVAAQLAAEAHADQFLVVSALGADPDSRIFYNRMKGEMEVAVRRQPFQAVWVVRPALLLGDREEVRLGERLAESLVRPLSPLLVGRLRRYRPVQARDVAAALIALAAQEGTGGVVESEEIETLAKSVVE